MNLPNRTGRLLVLALLSLFAAGALFAQAPTPGQGQGPRRFGGQGAGGQGGGGGFNMIGNQVMDTDGDGLSDENENAKYFTSPTNKDTDGNGVIDSDWNERRQFAYSIRAVVRVLKPCANMPQSDDFQDVRIVAQTDEYVDLEIIAYLWHRGLDSYRLPDFRMKRIQRRQFTRLPDNISWRDDYAGMTEWLKPGKVCNWDAEMREQIIEELRNVRIDPDQLTDTDLVETVAVWLLEGSRCLSKSAMPYLFNLKGAKPVLPNEFELFFARNSPFEGRGWNEYAGSVFSAKKMWESKTYEWGLSWCSYFATVMRSLGVPTRIVQFVPIINADSREQRYYLAQSIKPEDVKNYLDDSVRFCFANQMLQDPVQVITMNEVYIGNRWTLLYLPKDLKGIMFPASPRVFHVTPGYLFRVHTFADPGDQNYSASWGKQMAGLLKVKDMPGPLPFRILSLTPRVGKFNRLIINGLTNLDAVVDSSLDALLDPMSDSTAPPDANKAYLSGLMAGQMAGMFEIPDSSSQDLYFNLRPRYFDKKVLTNAAIETATLASTGPAWTGYSFFPEAVKPATPATGTGTVPAGTVVKPPEGTAVNPAAAAVVTPAAKVTHQVTLAFWFDSPRRPATIPPLLANTNDGGGYFLIQIQRENENQTLDETFLKYCAREFRLRAQGVNPVKVEMMPVYWKSYFVLRIPPEEYRKMQAGVPYRLTPGDQTSEYQWRIKAGVFLEKPGAGAP
ncbi:MAG: hypothetical protein J0L75_15460 [Spirochaetes bacterium]|nr:hypothetical protein [Spirochaetota bacterium]